MFFLHCMVRACGFLKSQMLSLSQNQESTISREAMILAVMNILFTLPYPGRYDRC